MKNTLLKRCLNDEGYIWAVNIGQINTAGGWKNWLQSCGLDSNFCAKYVPKDWKSGQIFIVDNSETGFNIEMLTPTETKKYLPKLKTMYSFS